MRLAASNIATLGDDYTRSATTITIPAGSLTSSVMLTAKQDTLDEDNETIVVDIDSVNNGTESGNQRVTATIIDDDPEPAVTLSLTGSPNPHFSSHQKMWRAIVVEGRFVMAAVL